MAFNITIPDFSSKPSGSKDLIITLLTHEWPLTIRQIYSQLKKRYSYNSSYQAVFKSLGELTEKGVLTKKNLKYSINIDWIKKVQSFTDIVETNYYAKKTKESLSGLKDSATYGESIILNFENVFDAEKYLYYFMKTILFKEKKKNICYQINSEWKPIFYLRAEYNYYTRLLKRGHKIFFVCRSNSKLEKENKKFYEELGIKFKIKKSSHFQDTVSFSDHIIQIFIPENIRNKIREFLTVSNRSMLRNVLSQKTNVRMVISKDSALSNEFQRKIISEFK